MKVVYVIQEENGKKFWHRCGVAFENKDGSVNLKLDLFPNLQLQVRDKEQAPAKLEAHGRRKEF